MIDLQFGQISTADINEIPAILQGYLQSLQDQFNSQPQIYPISGNQELPAGIKAGDIVAGFDSTNKPYFGFYDGENNQILSQATIQKGIGFVGTLSGATDPDTTNFPSDGNWGFYNNTGSSSFFLAFNQGGSILKTQLS